MLHAYIKLAPISQMQRLKDPTTPRRERRTDREDPWPALFIDSTRRSWTPDLPLSPNMTRTLSRLFRHLRANVSPPEARALAERFTWATPVELWQFLTGNMYRLDLRYYEPRSRNVYVPQLHKDLREQWFGLPAT